MQRNMWEEIDGPGTSFAVRWGYRRSPKVPPHERLAEERVGARLAWNLAVVRGASTADAFGASGAYRLLAPTAFLHDAATRFKVLQVREWLRFGNAVRQLVNVFHVAERYGVPRIEFPEPHSLFLGSESEGIKLAWSPPPQLPPEIANLIPGRPGLKGDFFILGGLGLRPSPGDQAAMIVRHVRRLVVPKVTDPNAEVRESDLVVHFRGGDVFRSEAQPGVHREYAQPPLAYYLAAVERERPSRVWLVHEDRRNPAVDATAAALLRQGIEVRHQSADLAADLNVLFNARTLIASFGSFCLAIAALSTRVRKLCLFGGPVAVHRLLGVHVTEAIDTVGRYRDTVSAHWTSSPEQLAMMMSYPKDAIAFREHPPIRAPRAPGLGPTPPE